MVFSAPESNVEEVHSLVRSLVLDGKGPSRIAAELNERGLRNRRGAEWSAQRVHQLAREVIPSGAIVLELKRCRTHTQRTLSRLHEAAATDAEAAQVHAAFLRERKGGSDTLDALDVATATIG